MSISEIIPLVEALPHSDKFQLMQTLLTQLAREEGVSLQVQAKPKANEGQRMAAILQRMADREALSHITNPGSNGPGRRSPATTTHRQSKASELSGGAGQESAQVGSQCH